MDTSIYKIFADSHFGSFKDLNLLITAFTHRSYLNEHRKTAAEHNEKGEHEAGSWHADRALEYSDHAYKLAKEAHNKSGQMVTL